MWGRGDTKEDSDFLPLATPWATVGDLSSAFTCSSSQASSLFMPCCFMFSVVLSIAGHRDCSDLFPGTLFLLSSHTLFETGSHVAKTVFDLLCSQCLSLSNAGITGLHQSAQLSSPTSVLRCHCPTAALSPLDSHSLEHLLNILPLCLYSTVPTILPAQSVCGR